MLNLQQFATDLQATVAGSSKDSLPGDIYTQISLWIGATILPLLTGVAILATLLFTFYGAFLYFTAYGDENRATQAKKSITFAIIGFVITLLAFSISGYVQNIILRSDANKVIDNPVVQEPADSFGIPVKSNAVPKP